MGSKLSPTKRAKLPKSDFACPTRAPGSGSYPIDKPTRNTEESRSLWPREDDTKL